MPAVQSPDGLSLAYTHMPGDEPGLVFVHATGFCKEVWRPVVGHFSGSNEVLALDQRGHGESEVGPSPFDWWDLGRDVLALIAETGPGSRIGVGHSSGAAALVMAEVMAPGSFDGLVLVEPIVLPPPYERSDDDPLVDSARQRKPSFPSREAALESFRGRGPFTRWSDEALEEYVAHGFRDEGGRWALCCTPDTESEFYATARLHGAWERLGEVGCPAIVLAGADTTAPVRGHLDEQAALFADAELRIVSGAGHFLPMERPPVVAAAVTEMLARLGAG